MLGPRAQSRLFRRDGVSTHSHLPAYNQTPNDSDLRQRGIFLFLLFRAAPATYRGSQARGLIGVQLPAYATATATPDPSRVCDLHHNSRQRRILHPLSEVRDGTHNFLAPNQIRIRCATMETPRGGFVTSCSRVYSQEDFRMG